MNGLQYMILANLYMAVLLGFYLLFLKKETFFQLNRVYLICALLLSFVMPTMQAKWLESLNVTRQLKYTILAGQVNIFAGRPKTEESLSFSQAAFYLYIAGVIVFAVYLLIRLLAVKRLLRSAKGLSSFSFFKKIHLSDEAVSPLICEHENIHASQWHSADIMLMELIVIFNWFNPAVYFFRKELKNVHEFIADEGALRSAGSKKEYAMLLVSQTFEVPINNLVNTFFNQNLLKQRIMMIQKNKSRKRALLKYLLSAPIFVLMLILSSATVDSYSSSRLSSNTASNESLNFVQDSKNKVFTEVEKEPSFPGGEDAFIKFLGTNIKYPAEMKKKKVQGKVFVSFIVEEDGSLSNMKVLRDAGYGSGKESVRVLSMSPKWRPGVQNGKKVRVQYTVPINFTLKS